MEDQQGKYSYEVHSLYKIFITFLSPDLLIHGMLISWLKINTDNLFMNKVWIILSLILFIILNFLLFLLLGFFSKNYINFDEWYNTFISLSNFFIQEICIDFLVKFFLCPHNYSKIIMNFIILYYFLSYLLLFKIFWTP